AHDRQARAVAAVVAGHTPLMEFVTGLNPLGELSFTIPELFAERGRQVVERADPLLEVGAERRRTDQVSFLDGRMRHGRLTGGQRVGDSSTSGQSPCGRSSPGPPSPVTFGELVLRAPKHALSRVSGCATPRTCSTHPVKHNLRRLALFLARLVSLSLSGTNG